MGKATSRIVSFVVIPVLVLAVLLLPPISLTTRIAEIGYERVDRAGGTIRAGDGMELIVSSGAVAKNIPVKIDVVPRVDFQKQAAGDAKAAAAAFSSSLKLLSPTYSVDTRGNSVSQATLSIPIPNGVESEALRSVDVYGWNGSRWQWMPSRAVIEDDRILADARPLPLAVAVVQAPAVKKPVVSAWLPQGGAVDTGAKDVVAELNPIGLAINTDGTIMGDLSRLQWSKDDKYLVVPTIQNRAGDVFDEDLIRNILQNTGLRTKLLQNIVQLVNNNIYAGIDLDIRGMDKDDPALFSSFVVDLAKELHKSNKLLSVTVPAPVQISEDVWQTPGYNWAVLGGAADAVKVNVVSSPADYLTRLDRTLAFAVSQVDRQKVQVVLSTYSRVSSDDLIVDQPYAAVVKTATQIQVNRDPSKPALTSEAVNVSLPNLAEAPVWDSQAKATKLVYREGTAVRTVWLEGAASLAYKLRSVLDYGIRGIAVRELLGDGNNPEIWDVIGVYGQSAQVTAAEPAQGSIKVAWNVSGGQVQAATSGPSWASIMWKAPDTEGKYTVSAAIVDRPNVTPGAIAGQSGSVSIDVKAPTPTPVPTATPTPTPKPTATPVPVVVQAPQPPVDNPTYLGGVGYGFCINFNDNYEKALALTKGAGFGWAKIQVRWEEFEGSRGNVDWGKVDYVVNTAKAAGVKLILSFVAAPAWSRPGDTNMSVAGPPANPDDLANFIGGWVARHKGKINAIEVLNEQNLWYEWGGEESRTPRIICDISRRRSQRSSRSIRGHRDLRRPHADRAPMPWAIEDTTYLEQLYQAGLRNYSDVVGVHANVWDNMPDDTPSYKANPAWYAAKGLNPASKDYGHHMSFYYLRFTQLRDIMVKYGDAGKEIWFTEFGWPSSADPYSEYAYAKNINEQDQADFLVRAFAIAKAKGYVGVMAVWDLNYASSAEPNDRYAKLAFSVLRRDWSPRPAYGALQNMPK